LKLLTICEKSESLYKLNEFLGVKLEEYSWDEYLAFNDICKKYYVSRKFYWYETDMSDNDSGTIYDDYPINYSNMIINNGKLHGVLVSTRAFFPDYFILEFEKGHKEAALGGGYNSLDYDWWIKKHENKDQEFINITSKYVLVKQKITYDNGTLSTYIRDIIGFLSDSLIVEDNNIIGLKYVENDSNLYEFIFSNKDTFLVKNVCKDGTYETTYTYTLIELNKAFLDNHITNVTYDDFKNGNYKILDC